MTAESTAAVPAADGYTPECYVMHVTDVVFWRPGLTAEDIYGNKVRVSGAVERVARAVLGETVEPVAEDADIAWPDGLTPQDYLASLSRRMAGPIWQRYTAVQRERMHRFAAHYVLDQMKQFFGPAELRPAPSVPPEVRAELPYAVRCLLTERFLHMTEYRKSMVMVSAYVQTHPPDEVDGAELHELVTMLWKPSDRRPFF